MRELQTLSVFVNSRLTAVGEEILRTIRNALLEYQSEILRSKEENERLKRLLSVAVQRRLLQPETSTCQPGEDGKPCDWASKVELLPQVKEEPQEEKFGHEEPIHRLDRATAETSSPPPSTSQDLKGEVDTEGNRRPDNGEEHSPTIHQTCRLTRSDSCASSERRVRTRKAEQKTKGSVRSNGIQGAHVLQITNIRSLKPLRSCSSHPGQSIKRWHSCKECGKSFNFACQLEVHMRWHTKEKPYGCTVCKKSFTTVSMLKRHHRIHTGEKPFRCHVCGKCFNQTAHLNTHFRLHNKESAGWRQVAKATASTVK